LDTPTLQKKKKKKNIEGVAELLSMPLGVAKPPPNMIERSECIISKPFEGDLAMP
jgi:hypothetical protein